MEPDKLSMEQESEEQQHGRIEMRDPVQHLYIQGEHGLQGVREYYRAFSRAMPGEKLL